VEQTWNFEIVEPSSRAIIVESLLRSQTPLTFTTGSMSAAGRVFACFGDALVMIRLDGPPLDGETTACCEIHGVPFLVRGRLWRCTTNADRTTRSAWAETAILSDVRVYSVGSDSTRIHLAPADARCNLARAHLAQRFPRLVPRAQVEGVELEELVRASGYLKLRQLGCSIDEWQRFSADFSFDYVYRTHEGRVLGHLSGTRVYERTWLAHQLATLGGHPESGASRAMLYEFMSALPRLLEGERGFFLAYFNLQSRWHRVFFKDFVPWVNDPALSVVVEWDCFEQIDGVANAKRLTPAAPSGMGGLCVGPVEPSELEAATALVRAQLPALMSDALDLQPERLGCAALNGDPSRSRTAIAVRSSRSLLGVALCESGPTSASLFNLLNIAQLFVPDAPPGVSEALLRAVLAHYAERGIERPLLLALPGTVSVAREPALRFRERMGAIAHGGAGLMQYESYICVQMGRFFRRKERVHGPRSHAPHALE
jgi:hypothetical protein